METKDKTKLEDKNLNCSQDCSKHEEHVKAHPKKPRKNHKKDFKKKYENLKKEFDVLKTKSFNLEMENMSLKNQIQINNQQFAEKAKTFSTKAQEELNKLKQENLQKVDLEIQDVKKYGTQKFFESFLLPFGNLELAIKAGINQDNPAVNNYVRGFEMLVNQIENLMQDFGLEKIVPQIDGEYLPELHQAFAVVSQEGRGTNSIVEVKSNGYKLYDRVIKPAIVIVAK